MDSRLTRPSIERNQPAELLIWGIIPELKDFSVSASGQLTAQQVAIARTVSQRVQGDIMRELSVPLEMLAVVKYRDQQGRDDNIALLAREDWEGAMHLLAYVLSLPSIRYCAYPSLVCSVCASVSFVSESNPYVVTGGPLARYKSNTSSDPGRFRPASFKISAESSRRAPISFRQ